MLLKTQLLSQAWGQPGKQSTIIITGIEIMHAKKKNHLKAAGPVSAHAHAGRIVRLLGYFTAIIKGVGDCPPEHGPSRPRLWPITQSS